LGRVLVVQPAFLGDVVFTSALVDSLAERYEVDVCVTPRGRDAALAMPRVSQVLVFDKRGADRGVRGLLRVARRIAERRHDVAVLPHASLRSALLARLARIPRRVGFRGAPGSFLYTERIRTDAATVLEREAALARALEAEPRPMRIAPQPSDAELPQRFAALCIGSEWETKIWPAQRFGELADELQARGLAPVLLGAAREKPLAEAVQRAAKASCRDTTGNTVGEAIAILARAQLCVGGDTGLVHAARALGVPTVAVFGPTSPARHQFAPNQRAVSLGLDCSPCSEHGQRKCPLGHHQCMRDLDAGRVASACDAVLG
jgi:heptosyltransferase-2